MKSIEEKMKSNPELRDLDSKIKRLEEGQKEGRVKGLEKVKRKLQGSLESNPTEKSN
jgi:hypothetical protein